MRKIYYTALNHIGIKECPFLEFSTELEKQALYDKYFID